MRSLFASFLARWGISLAGLAAFLCLAMLRHAAPSIYLIFTALPDSIRRPVPFVDLRSILQAGACWRAGVDVYVPSACMGGGVFNYSPFMLRAFSLPLSPADTQTGGVLLCLIFFAALALLPPVRSRGEFAIRLAGALSPTTGFALEQGNFDAILFAAALAALWLLRHAWPARLAGYALFLLAAALKFYPAALLLLALRESRRHFLIVTALSAAAGGAFLLCFAHATFQAAAILPGGMPFHATFGAVDFPRGLNHRRDLSVHFINSIAHFLGLGRIFTTNAGLVNCTMVLMDLAAAAFIATGWRRATARLAQLTEPERLYFIGAASLIMFCFFAAQNVSYRAIFLIPALPALWRMAIAAPQAKLPRRLLAATLFLLWEAAFRSFIGWLAQAHALPGKINWLFVFWLIREPVWWWLVIQLGRLCLAYIIPKAQRLSRPEIDAAAQKT